MLNDEEAGLYMVVLPKGGKGWRIDYTKPDGRRTTASLGTYPLVSLKEARAAAYEMRAAIKKGRDAIAEKKTAQERRKAEQERAAILRAGGVLPGTLSTLRACISRRCGRAGRLTITRRAAGRSKNM